MESSIKDICKLLLSLNKISVRKEREDLIKQNDCETLRFLLETLLNPYVTLGVKKISKEISRRDTPTLFELKDVRRRLVSREITGNAAVKLLESTLNCPDEEVRECLVGVFMKELRLGGNVSTVNKVFPNFIPTFDLGLCDEFDDKKVLPKGQWAVEPKYDGLRGVIVIDENGVIQVYSRTGKEMYNTEYITDELKSLNLKGWVFDGEIFGMDWNLSCGVAHTKSDHPDKKHLKFHIFDMLPLENWKNKTPTVIYRLRKEAIRSTLVGNLKNLVSAPEVIVETYDQAVVEYKKRLKEGYEGVVMKEINSVYPFDRSKYWLKWKPVQTQDVKIVSYYEGTGRNVGRLGGFICDYKGEEVRVGGGYSDELRETFWKEKDNMIGMILETEAQETTKDGKLRFPNFVRLRIDRE